MADNDGLRTLGYLYSNPVGKWGDAEWLAYQEMLFRCDAYAPSVFNRYTHPLRRMGGFFIVPEEDIGRTAPFTGQPIPPEYERLDVPVTEAKKNFESWTEGPIVDPETDMAEYMPGVFVDLRQYEVSPVVGMGSWRQKASNQLSNAVSWKTIQRALSDMTALAEEVYQERVNPERTAEEQAEAQKLHNSLNNVARVRRLVEGAGIPLARVGEAMASAGGVSFKDYINGIGLEGGDLDNWKQAMADIEEARIKGWVTTPFEELMLAYRWYQGIEDEAEYQSVVSSVGYSLVLLQQGVPFDATSDENILIKDLMEVVMDETLPYRNSPEIQAYFTAGTGDDVKQMLRMQTSEWLRKYVAQEGIQQEGPAPIVEFYDPVFGKDVNEMTNEEKDKVLSMTLMLAERMYERILVAAGGDVTAVESIVANDLGSYLPSFWEEYAGAIMEYTGSTRYTLPTLSPEEQAVMRKLQTDFPEIFPDEKTALRYIARNYDTMEAEAGGLGYLTMDAYMKSEDFAYTLGETALRPTDIPEGMLARDIRLGSVERFGLGYTVNLSEEILDVLDEYEQFVRQNVENPYDPEEYKKFVMEEDVEEYFQDKIETFRPEITEVEEAINKAMSGMPASQWATVFDEYRRVGKEYFAAKRMGYVDTLEGYIMEKGVEPKMYTNLILANRAVQSLVRQYTGAGEFLRQYGGAEAFELSPVEDIEEPTTFDEMWAMADVAARTTAGQRIHEPLRQYHMGILRQDIEGRTSRAYKLAQRIGTVFPQYLAQQGFSPREMRVLAPYTTEFQQEYLGRALAAAGDVTIDSFTGEMLRRERIPSPEEYLKGIGRERLTGLIPRQVVGQVYRRVE